MRKKVPAGKGIANAGKKKLPKKIKVAPITLRKTAGRKKETKQTVATKKVPAGKVKSRCKRETCKGRRKKIRKDHRQS